MSFENFNNRFITAHLRDASLKDNQAILLSTGGATLVMQLLLNDDLELWMVWGISVTHEDDNFNRETGRRLAAQRLVKARAGRLENTVLGNKMKIAQMTSEGRATGTPEFQSLLEDSGATIDDLFRLMLKPLAGNDADLNFGAGISFMPTDRREVLQDLAELLMLGAVLQRDTKLYGAEAMKKVFKRSVGNYRCESRDKFLEGRSVLTLSPSSEMSANNCMDSLLNATQTQRVNILNKLQEMLVSLNLYKTAD